MTTLTVESLGAGSIGISAPIPLPSSEDIWAWDDVAAKFLVYAYFDRPACLMTAYPQEWSLAHDIGNTIVTQVGNVPYLLSFVEHCSPQFLVELTENSDFSFGTVRLASLRREDKWRIHNLILAVDASNTDVPQTTEEVLFPVSDGKGVWWLNPNKPIRDVVAEVTKITEGVGWSVNVNASKLL